MSCPGVIGILKALLDLYCFVLLILISISNNVVNIGNPLFWWVYYTGYWGCSQGISSVCWAVCPPKLAGIIMTPSRYVDLYLCWSVWGEEDIWLLEGQVVQFKFDDESLVSQLVLGLYTWLQSNGCDWISLKTGCKQSAQDFAWNLW
jgi:hypothetical protein